jgi:hypothetical protein
MCLETAIYRFALYSNQKVTLNMYPIPSCLPQPSSCSLNASHVSPVISFHFSFTKLTILGFGWTPPLANASWSSCLKSMSIRFSVFIDPCAPYTLLVTVRYSPLPLYVSGHIAAPEWTEKVSDAPLLILG